MNSEIVFADDPPSSSPSRSKKKKKKKKKTETTRELLRSHIDEELDDSQIDIDQHKTQAVDKSPSSKVAPPKYKDKKISCKWQ